MAGSSIHPLNTVSRYLYLRLVRAALQPSHKNTALGCCKGTMYELAAFQTSKPSSPHTSSSRSCQTQAENLQGSLKLLNVQTEEGGRAFPESCDAPRTPKSTPSAGVHYLTPQEKATDHPLLLAATSCHSRGISHRLANAGAKNSLNKTLLTTALNGLITYLLQFRACLRSKGFLPVSHLVWAELAFSIASSESPGAVL